MEFSELEKKHGFFYVPAFQVLVDGKDLLKESVEIFSVSVDLVLNAAGSFTFTVNNPYDPDGESFPYLQKDGLFKLGNEVVVRMGYGNRAGLATILLGYISGHDVSFPANGLSQLTVKGFDRLHYLMKEQHSENWGSDDQPISYSEIVKEIVSRNSNYGVRLTEVQDTGEKHRQIKQDRETDFAFIKKLAEKISFEVFVRQDELFFREPASSSSETVTSLVWRRSLSNASPRVNTANQISGVEVRGWDPAAQEAIVGTATSGDETGRDSGDESGAEAVSSTQGEQVKHLWRPVSSQKEADDLAKAILDRSATGFVEANGDCIGLPELIPGENVELGGLGTTYSKKYYIKKATHSVNASGYKTTFAAEESTL